MLDGCQDDAALVAAQQAFYNKKLDDFERHLDEIDNINLPMGPLNRTLAHDLVLSKLTSDKEYFDQAISIFVKMGGDLNRKDFYGLTPLHYAVREQCSQSIYRILVNHGAKENIQDKKGLIPKDYKRMWRKNSDHD